MFDGVTIYVAIALICIGLVYEGFHGLLCLLRSLRKGQVADLAGESIPPCEAQRASQRAHGVPVSGSWRSGVRVFVSPKGARKNIGVDRRCCDGSPSSDDLGRCQSVEVPSVGTGQS